MLLFYKNTIYNLFSMKKRELLAELLGTFILVFAWTWAMIVDHLTWSLWNVWIGLVFGFVIVVLVYTFWHISWAHFNPAVTLWLSVAKKFDKNKVIDYVLGRPSLIDKNLINKSIDLLIDEINNFFSGESTKLMNKLNGDNK